MGSFIHDISCTILNTESLSHAVCIGGEHTLIGVQYPAAWTAGEITFQVSFDGVTWRELADDSGTAISKSVTAGQYRELDSAEFKSAIFLKIRSGTVDVPVAQEADRAFTLFTRRYAAR